MQRKKLKYFIAVGLSILIFSCTPSYFIVKDFNLKTQDHKRVAVIPVEMVFTGAKPAKVTEAQIDSIEVSESKQFQNSLFNNLLLYSNSKRGTVSVEFQSYEKTNKTLQELGISVRDAWSKSPEMLCKVLGVDAVVKTRIVKQRYMSDLASFGLQTAGRILNGVVGGGMAYPLMRATNGGRTNDIDAQCTLFNKTQDEILWKDMHKGAADWNSPANQIIERITVQFGKNFPYRKR